MLVTSSPATNKTPKTINPKLVLLSKRKITVGKHNVMSNATKEAIPRLLLKTSLQAKPTITPTIITKKAFNEMNL